VASYFLFVAVLAAAFGTAELAIPTAIFVIGVAFLFITPAWWARTLPKDERPRQSWSEFMAEGVECNTGHLKAGEALAQILVLPALLVSLAMVMAVIKATL
jgi:Flp pilus assembly protein TadB